MESLHSHRLALVPGPVDDGATAPLAQDAALALRVLQLAVLQEEPAVHTAQGLASSLGQGVAWTQLMLSHPGEQYKVTCVLATRQAVNLGSYTILSNLSLLLCVADTSQRPLERC